MIIKRDVFTKTCSAGTVSWNTDNLKGHLETLIIKPSVETSTYDFTMTDDQDVVLINETGKLGTHRETTKYGIYGVYTCKITNSSPSTESFTVEITYREIPSP